MTPSEAEPKTAGKHEPVVIGPDPGHEAEFISLGVSTIHLRGEVQAKVLPSAQRDAGPGQSVVAPPAPSLAHRARDTAGRVPEGLLDYLRVPHAGATPASEQLEPVSVEGEDDAPAERRQELAIPDAQRSEFALIDVPDAGREVKSENGLSTSL